MSGGSSEGNGIVRHRHCPVDAAAPCGGDGNRAACLDVNLEDDASSLPRPSRRPPAWKRVAVDLIWGFSTIFVVYYGDGRSNLVEILLSDGRIHRSTSLLLLPLLVSICLLLDPLPVLWQSQGALTANCVLIRRKVLYVGLVSAILNFGAILFATLLTWGPQSYDEKYETFVSIAPSVIGLGFFSFCALSYALWPVWGFLTILLTITLFMASVVILSYTVNGPFRDEFLRDD